MIHPLNLTKNSDELKQLIAENPDLPIVFLVGQDAPSDEYGYVYCSDIRFNLTEVLDCKLPFDHTYVYDDRISFEEDLANYLSYQPECENLFDLDFDNYVGEKLKEYEPYWKKVIAIYANK